MEKSKKLMTYVALALVIMSALLLASGTLSSVSAASSTGGSGSPFNDSAGNNLVDALKKFAVSGWGKAAFAICILIAIGCFLSARHRGFGLVALIFGVLLGAYGGIVDSLWNWVTGVGSGGSSIGP